MKKWTYRVGLSLLVGATVGAGCSSEPEEAPSNGVVYGAPIEESKFIESFSSTICDAMGSCCQAATFSFDRNGCDEKYTKIATNKKYFGDQLKLKYNAQNAGNCVATYRAILGKCKVGFDLNILDAACGDVYEGHLKQGEICQDKEECSPGLICMYDGKNSTICAPPSSAKTGEQCVKMGPSGTTYVSLKPCEIGNTCVIDPVAKSGTCTESATEGQPCPDGACKPGLYCDQRSKPSTCNRRAAQGEDCSGSFSPTSSQAPLCGETLVCNKESKCSPQERPFEELNCKFPSLE